jgi:hypothetical protein
MAGRAGDVGAHQCGGGAHDSPARKPCGSETLLFASSARSSARASIRSSALSRPISWFGCGDRAERGGQVLTECDAVEADHADVTRYRKAAPVRGPHRTDREQVVRAEQRGRPACLSQRSGDLLDRRLDERHLDQRQRLQAGRLHASKEAVVAQLRPVARGALPADHRDAPMAERSKPRDCLGQRLDAIDRDARMARMPVVRQHVADAIGTQLTQGDRGRRVRDDEDDSVDAGGAQRADRAELGFEPVLGGHRHDRVAAGRGGLGDAVQAFREHRVQQRRQHDTEHAAALRAQCARARIGSIVDAPCSQGDAPARLLAHALRSVERARHRRDRDAGLAGDVKDAHAAA